MTTATATPAAVPFAPSSLVDKYPSNNIHDDDNNNTDVLPARNVHWKVNNYQERITTRAAKEFVQNLKDANDDWKSLLPRLQRLVQRLEDWVR